MLSRPPRTSMSPARNRRILSPSEFSNGGGQSPQFSKMNLDFEDYTTGIAITLLPIYFRALFFYADRKIFLESKYRLLDRSPRVCAYDDESSCTCAFLLLRNAAASSGEVSGILLYRMCARERVGICSRRFNVYHRDICGCTCIINALARLAVAVQSLRRHVIARAVLSRVSERLFSPPSSPTSPPRG